MLSFIRELFYNYGYIVLFTALAIELIGFPTPGETLLTYCGILVSQGRLQWSLSIIVATIGLSIGITISYFIGRALGATFFQKYGSYIHLGPDRLEKTSKWFQKYGNWLLVVAYFIPGVRHITGYFSGITKTPFKKFALFSYIGAFAWAATFISLGKVVGGAWKHYSHMITKYIVVGLIIIGLVALIVYIYRKYKDSIVKYIFMLWQPHKL